MNGAGRLGAVVIPAAGRGTRLLPATLAVRKELLPAGRQPLIAYAVAEAEASGAERVVVVVAAGDESLPEYFARAGTDANGEAKLVFVEQQGQRGLADAIRCARGEVGGGAFGVILPDALIRGGRPCIGQLFACHRRHGGMVVATRQVAPEETRRYGILAVAEVAGVGGEGVVRAHALVEKPSRAAAPSLYGVFGRYLLTAEIFAAIERLRPDRAGELQLTDALNAICQEGQVYGCLFEGRHFDTGSWAGYAEANVDCLLDDAEIGPGVAALIAARGVWMPAGRAPHAATGVRGMSGAS